MSANVTDRLYKLLPAVYRLRDSAQGEPLRALLTLIAREYGELDQNIQGLYENWFIETCEEWVVPYIGDLLGVRPLYPVNPGTFSARAYVANTLRNRRRKGTAAMLEQLALDVTGWRARVVEFFELLATTQYLNHLRPGNLSTLDLRDTATLEKLGGPFENAAHTADVRHISSGRGKYNVPNLGIFVWRLQDYFIGPIPADATKASRQSDARAVAASPDGRYTFDPLGIDAPLFNRPQTKTDDTLATDEVNVPGMLRRRPLYEELEALRQAEVDNALPATPVYFGSNPAFQIRVDGVLVPSDQVMVCDISDVSASDWRRPPATQSYTPSGGGAPVPKKIALSVDPVRGRIAFPVGANPSKVELAYSYGLSADVGAGPYDRSAWLSDPATGPGPYNNFKSWRAAVSQELAPKPGVVFPTLADAVQEWNKQPAGRDGVIAVLDSRTYSGDLAGANKIEMKEGSRLLIVAADWPAQRDPASLSQSLDPEGLRPHFLGKIEVHGAAPANSPSPGQFFVDGLLIEGQVTVLAGNLGTLGLSHTTVTPAGGLAVASSGVAGGDNSSLALNLYRAICGPIALDKSVSTLSLADSIVTSGPASADNAAAITAPGATANVQTTTVFGSSSARVIEAGNSIFTGVVTAGRRQAGCVRFSYIPDGSKTARRYHCQPDLALVNVPTAQQATVRLRLAPQFTSVNFGQPFYAQLGSRCASEISSGAEDQSEMGVFSFLQQPQRRANLLTAFDEYLRLGLEARMIEET